MIEYRDWLTSSVAAAVAVYGPAPCCRRFRLYNAGEGEPRPRSKAILNGITAVSAAARDVTPDAGGD